MRPPNKKQVIKYPIKTEKALIDFLNEAYKAIRDYDSKKPKELKDLADKAQAGAIYITKYTNDLRQVFHTRDATTRLEEAAASLREKEAELRELQKKRINFSAQTVVPHDSGEYCGNGKFYVRFVNVGAGDCTLIGTPNGRRIMIDCGSSSLEDVTSVIEKYDPEKDGTAEDVITKTVQSETFLRGVHQIDILVISHPDDDHHNKLEKVLGRNMKIGFIYFGGAEDVSAFYPTSNYIARVAGSTAVCRKMTLNEDEAAAAKQQVQVNKQINDAPIPPRSAIANNIGNEFIDPHTGEIVLYEEDNGFRLSVLASNVVGAWQDGKFVKKETDIKKAGELKMPSTAANRGSLVVLASCFGKQVLICGDATAVTERFMLNHFSTQLATVQTLRMGHHGSPTSSCQAFIDALTNMEVAVASTSGEKTVGHYLPKYKILNLYRPKLKKSPPTDNHYIWAFDSDKGVSSMEHLKIIKVPLYATGSNNTRPYCFAKSN